MSSLPTDTPAAPVTGLSAGLGLVCMIMAVLIAIIFILRRRMNVSIPEPDSNGLQISYHNYCYFMPTSTLYNNGFVVSAGLHQYVGYNVILVINSLSSSSAQHTHVCNEPADSTETIRLKSQPSSVRATPLYENTQLPSSATSTATGHRNKYENVFLRPSTQRESAAAAQCEEIELSTNAAYGKFRR